MKCTLKAIIANMASISQADLTENNAGEMMKDHEGINNAVFNNKRKRDKNIK